MEMLRNRLLISELGVLGAASESLLLLNFLFGLNGVQADALQVDREILQFALLVPPGLVLLFDLVDELADRDASDAALAVDHVRPGFLGRARRADP